MSREANSQTKSRPEVPDSLVEPLRRMVIAVEWFRAAYPLKENPRENRLLYQQLAEMKRQSAPPSRRRILLRCTSLEKSQISVCDFSTSLQIGIGSRFAEARARD